MTRDEAKHALSEAAAAINLAASILRPHMELFETYKEERQEMENFGHIFDPTLYRDPERRAADALMYPLIIKAHELVTTFDRQIQASKNALERISK